MTLRELQNYAAPEQIAGFTRYHLAEGMEQGVEMIEVRNGGGLRFGVCPSRGLDVMFAELNGQNLTWRHPNGFIEPTYYGVDNFDWLRGGPCGLITTCGLNAFGQPSEDNGEKYSLHDRYSYLPARDVSTRTVETEKGLVFEVRGTVRQTRLFGTNLRLERTISVPFGENRLYLHDRVINDGFEACPMVILYHCNFGYPLLEEGGEVIIDSTVKPLTENCATGLDNWNGVEAPIVGFKEMCFFHDVNVGDDNRCYTALWNPKRNLGVALHYSKEQLPNFTQWKMVGAGTYVMGLEPSNAHLTTRAKLKEQGLLPILDAGDSRDFEVEFEFFTEKK